MEKMLRQEEIDALFETARSGQAGSAAVPEPTAVVPYSFTSSGQISTEQYMPSAS